MKVCENFKFVMPRYKFAFPSEDTDDPSAVLLYMMIHANKRAAPESIMALNLFPACTVTVRQSDTSPMM